MDGALAAAETWHLKTQYVKDEYYLQKINIACIHASGFTSDSLVTNKILYSGATTKLQIDVRKLLIQKHFKRQNGSVKGSTLTHNKMASYQIHQNYLTYLEMRGPYRHI